MFEIGGGGGGKGSPLLCVCHCVVCFTHAGKYVLCVYKHPPVETFLEGMIEFRERTMCVKYRLLELGTPIQWVCMHSLEIERSQWGGSVTLLVAIPDIQLVGKKKTAGSSHYQIQSTTHQKKVLSQLITIGCCQLC